jgi:Cysteine protease
MYINGQGYMVGGALPSQLDLRDYIASKSAVMVTELPEEFQVRNTTILNQGMVGSCVAHTVASFVESVREDGKYSTGWIYGYRPPHYHQGIGMQPRNALDTLRNVGELKYNDFPENVEMIVAKDLVDTKFKKYELKAEDTQILSYSALNKNNVKQWIYNNKYPVMITLFIGNYKEEKGIIYPPQNYDKSSGHAVLLLGWNKDGWIIQNSWGTGWGKKGIGIISYDYEINEFWGISMNKELTEKPWFYPIRKFIMKTINWFKDIFSKLF